MSDMILLAVVAFVMTSSSYPSSDSSSSSSSPSVPEKTVNWLEAALSFPRRGYHPVDGIPKPGVEDVCINTTVRDWECGEYKSTLIDIKERLHDVSFPPTELHNIVGDFFANSPAEALTVTFMSRVTDISFLIFAVVARLKRLPNIHQTARACGCVCVCVCFGSLIFSR
jgi:hypothetical protein